MKKRVKVNWKIKLDPGNESEKEGKRCTEKKIVFPQSRVGSELKKKEEE